MMKTKRTLFTEKNIKLFLIGLLIVSIFQCVSDATSDREPMQDECNPMEDSYCKVDEFYSMIYSGVKSNTEFCLSEIEQEIGNINRWIQTKEWAIDLLAKTRCEFDVKYFDIKEDDELHKCQHWDWEIYRGVKWRCN